MGSINITKPLFTFLSAAPFISLSYIDNFFLWKFFGNTGSQTRGCWVRNKYATSVLCSPQFKCNCFIGLASGQSRKAGVRKDKADSSDWNGCSCDVTHGLMTSRGRATKPNKTTIFASKSKPAGISFRRKIVFCHKIVEPQFAPKYFISVS